jgi:hypothetical protein
VKFGKSWQEILEMLRTVYGESAMKRRTVYKWVDRFKEGWESIDDNAREGCPSTSHVGENIQCVRDMVMSDRRITTRIIADKLGITKGSVQTILKDDLNMLKLCAKIVPKVLTQEQKRCVACCQDWMENEEGSNFLQKVVTGDESWIYEYDPATKSVEARWFASQQKSAHESLKNQDHAVFFI